MLDFMMVSTRMTKRGSVEIYPKFIIYNQSRKISDLMIRGGDFYAIWVEELGFWSTDERDALLLIDRELDNFAEANKEKYELGYKVIHMWDTEYGMIDKWHKFCQKQMRDCFHMLDEKLIFSNVKTTKTDYASKKLSYPLEPCETPAYDHLMSVLYSPEEREKIEWAIGSIVSGDSKKIQKFLVLYGAAGTGKSTVLNIIQQLFDGYYSVFDAKSLGSSNNSFALEAFKTNPLVAIQHDGDLSHIEDNTRLNSLVSHEMMTVNEKFKSQYANRFKCFLFMGTNKPVKITDAKSGLIRRLIDVSPTGEKLSPRDYKKTTKQIEFELGGIATHCLEVYESDPGRYDNYIPVSMLSASNDFYNYVMDSYIVFDKANGVSLKQAWEMYKTYCEDAKVPYPFSQRIFKEELKNYFEDYKERFTLDDGTRVRSYFIGFKRDKFDSENTLEEGSTSSLVFNQKKSLLDELYSDCPAQYANDSGTPMYKWENVKTTLKDIDTSKLHYVKIPQNHIVIDFDIPDESGNKSFELNLAAASKWPETYAELSKSGKGIHLHYIYTGDTSMLDPVYSDHIEVKVFNGNSSLRRKMSLCNDIPVRTISSGLPLKGEKVVNFEAIKNERGIRAMIKKNLNKEIHANTKPSIDFIAKILEDAYGAGINYDVTDMRPAIMAFAANSSHQSENCLKIVSKMKFKSDDPSVNEDSSEGKRIAFFDVEIFPNLFLLCWKEQGEGKKINRMFNPTPTEIERLISHYNLIGFNCRRYDNHIVYAALMGYSNQQLFDLSQRIITGSRNCFFGGAYNLSYTDIYDFSSVKQSLKKFEIDLGIHHEELGYEWDKPVPEDRWNIVADYCDNDVTATEAVFNSRQADFTARKILADIAGMTVNDTTNSLTTRIIFGTDRHPQEQFNYRDLGCDIPPFEIPNEEYTKFENGKPVFPGYVFEGGKSIYRGEEVGEGGYVYAEPGIYGNVALLDIASMHPSSIIAEDLFGKKYTKRFKDIRDARVLIKHGEFEKVKKMFDGKLEKYLTDESSAKQLAQALKIAINSVYGLTAANFDNPFRDIRNKDNIVAKRGALFMVNLKHEVQARGFTVAHIKTDSIKIPDATKDIIDFVMEYGKKYGYTFEHEATYERMCLVNDAVYVAKYDNGEWTATGTQFQVPYVFKTLFTHEPIVFDDLCETKSVTSALYLRQEPKRIVNPLTGKEEILNADSQPEFVGRVGRFCPIKKGKGGKELLRESRGKDGEIKFSAAVGTKGYSWLEAEVVKKLGKEDDIDRSYYDELVNKAVETICLFGDYDWFVSDVPYQPPTYVNGHPVYNDFKDFMNPPEGELNNIFK